MVIPEEFGRDPVAGVLVGADDLEMVVGRSDPQAGELHIHVPRAGYDLQAA